MDKLGMKSPNFTDQKIKKLAALFPNCVTEAKDKNSKPQKANNQNTAPRRLSEN